MKKSTKHLPRESLGNSYNSVGLNRICSKEIYGIDIITDHENPDTLDSQNHLSVHQKLIQSVLK